MRGLWRREGWADLSGGRVRLTAAGWLLLDGLAVDLAGAASRPTRAADTAARAG